MPAFEILVEGKDRVSCCLPTTTPCQLSIFLPRAYHWHRVSLVIVVVVKCGRACVWKGVDGALCGVQAHKCAKGGLEPESVESPILGMRPANHYPMPAFENFTEGKEKASAC